MDISIGRLTITQFCEKNIEHLNFKREMLEDGLMNYYFPNLHDDNFLIPSAFLENHRYVVKFEG